MTPQQIVAAVGCSSVLAQRWSTPLTDSMARFDISTPTRQAAFVAQVAHESGRFSAIEENLNYRADRLLAIFPKHFTPLQAQAYARQPSRIASRVYAGRLGNGDEISGDGWRFRGRGLIQTTGRDNYRECGEALGVDLLADPDRLVEPDLAALSAGLFWRAHGLNALADAGDFTAITKRINGGLNGQPERLALWASTKAVLGA